MCIHDHPATITAAFTSCRQSSSDCTDGSSNNSSGECDALNPAEQCLLEGLTDQLDATDAELEHLTQQMQQQQAAIAAAGAAALALRSKVDGMSSRQLAHLLQQMLDVLVEQGSHWAAAVLKVRQQISNISVKKYVDSLRHYVVGLLLGCAASLHLKYN
jgi:hypothetical protein